MDRINKYLNDKNAEGAFDNQWSGMDAAQIADDIIENDDTFDDVLGEMVEVCVQNWLDVNGPGESTEEDEGDDEES